MVLLVSLGNTGGNFPCTIAEADSSQEFFLWSEFPVITSAVSSDAVSFFSLGKISSSAKSKRGPLISSSAGCQAGLELESQTFALVFSVLKPLLPKPRQEFFVWKTKTERFHSDLQQMPSPIRSCKCVSGFQLMATFPNAKNMKEVCSAAVFGWYLVVVVVVVGGY